MEEQNTQTNKQTDNKKIIIIIVCVVLVLLLIKFAFSAFLFLNDYNKGQKLAEAKYAQVGGKKVSTTQNEKIDTILSVTEKYIIDTFVYAIFEDYDITENENKFYILSKNWKYTDFKDRKNIIELAAGKSECFRINTCKNNDKCVTNKEIELERTKIYDYETKQILGEYHIDKDAVSSDNVMNAVQAELSAYKFYEVK